MSDAVPLEQKCFFIAPIGQDGSSERHRSDGVLKFIVGKAADELGLIAIRGDQIGEPGQITLQVIDHILGARAAVADLTDINPNVFYELAVRHTGRLPVALIAEKDCKLPFDIAQMRTIFFDHRDLGSADQCRQAIVAQLPEALDNGAVDSPIATSVDVRAMQNGSVVERNIAELVTTIEEMSQVQRRSFLELTRLREDAMRDVRDPSVVRRFREVHHSLQVHMDRARERGDTKSAKELSAIDGVILSLAQRTTGLRFGGNLFRSEEPDSDIETVTPDLGFVENSARSAGNETPAGIP